MPHHLDINSEASLDFSALKEDALSAAVNCHVETTESDITDVNEKVIIKKIFFFKKDTSSPL